MEEHFFQIVAIIGSWNHNQLTVFADTAIYEAKLRDEWKKTAEGDLLRMKQCSDSKFLAVAYKKSEFIAFTWVIYIIPLFKYLKIAAIFTLQN